MAITNRSSENVAQFKYLGMTITNKKFEEEVERRLISGNACYKFRTFCLFVYCLER
jgi:hypothetical protein